MHASETQPHKCDSICDSRTWLWLQLQIHHKFYSRWSYFTWFYNSHWSYGSCGSTVIITHQYSRLASLSCKFLGLMSGCLSYTHRDPGQSLNCMRKKWSSTLGPCYPRRLQGSPPHSYRTHNQPRLLANGGSFALEITPLTTPMSHSWCHRIPTLDRLHHHDFWPFWYLGLAFWYPWDFHVPASDMTICNLYLRFRW